VVDYLRSRSEEAFTRASRLGARIAQLGGQPPAKLSELVELSTDKPFKLPASLADVDGVLRAVLDAERTSVRTYDALYEKTRAGDVVTAAVLTDLLAAAVRNEETIERLLGDPAPGMDGR
jgi:ferritin-like protein